MIRSNNYTRLRVLSAAGVLLAVVGCGGSGQPISAVPSKGQNFPQAGNYQGSIGNLGGVLVSADATGDLSITVGFSAMKGVYTGSTTIGANNTFATTLTNASNGQTTSVSGATFADHIQVTLGQAIPPANNITVNFEGSSNLLATNYSGTFGIGKPPQQQAMSLNVNDNDSNNVSGSLNSSSNGPLSVSGTLTAAGVFTATAPFGSSGGMYKLVGSFKIGASGKPSGSGVWTDSTSSSNSGIWVVTAN